MKNERKGESFTPKPGRMPPEGFFPVGTVIKDCESGMAIILPDNQTYNTMFVKYNQTIYKHLRYIVFAEDNTNIKE